MTSTTQILFNSPALHSLKRDQLVKLCKIHSIKASGKNVDLIDKLKKHAQTLPKDDPLSIAVRGESNEHDMEEEHDMNDTANETNQGEAARARPPSPNQDGPAPKRPGLKPTFSDWEVVMYSIAEEDESQNTVGSSKSGQSGHRGGAGEFGTSSSRSTVGSSIKALANSIGKLKKGHGSKSPKSTSSRNGAAKHEATDEASNELETTAMPYDSLPPSETPVDDVPLAFNPARMTMDGFLGDGETPLPGHALRPGVPAPENGRLSLGLNGAPATPTRPTTTIRLVGTKAAAPEPSTTTHHLVSATPQLKPFKTSFDIIMGSPAPASSIYPTLTFNDLPPSLTSMTKASQVLPSSSTNNTAPGGATDTSAPLPSTSTSVLPVPAARANDDPFVFGSPLPKHRVSDAQFKSAAASVLEEMNKRLQENGVASVDTGLIGRLHPGAHKNADLSRDVKPLPKPKGEMKEKFDQAHQQQFQKMEGIDSFVKRKEASTVPAKEATNVSAIAGKKRKSSVIPATGPRRPAGVWASGTRVISNGRRARVIPGAFGTDEDGEDEDPQKDGEHPDERAGKRIRVASDATVDSKDGAESAAPSKQAEEEDAVVREKERQAIKRKLEMNKAKRRSSTGPGMHGRRSARSSIVGKPPPKPSRFGFLSSAKSLVASVWGRGKTAVATSNAIPKPVGQPKSTAAPKKPIVPTKPNSTQAAAPPSRPTGVKPSSESTLTKPTAASSARARSPIPSFGVPSTRGSVAPTVTSLAAGATAASRKSSVTATNSSRASSAHVSSMGTRVSTTQPLNVGSMGTKRLASVSGSQSSLKPVSTPSSSSRLSVASRLFAPTASSLAKASRTPGGSGLKPVAETPTPAPAHKPVVETPTPAHPLKSPPVSRRPTAALDTITNSLAVARPPASSTGGGKPRGLFSPTRGKIFSQPLELGAPTPKKGSGVSPAGNEDAKSPIRQRSLNGKRPRVSRSKVIAKLANQRAAGSSGTAASASVIPRPSAATATSTAAPRRVSALAPKPGAKPRSSLGAKVARSSMGVVKVRASAGGNGDRVLLSAKKRVRQSEYHRRRSMVGDGSPVKQQRRQTLREGGDDAMDVDQ